MGKLNIAGPGNRFFTTWKFMKDPYTSYRNWKQKYGDTFLIKALNGDVVATCNTENIGRIFAAPKDAVGQFAIETTRPLVGDHSVFLLEGDTHRRERVLLSPSFHGEPITSKAEEICEVARRQAGQWKIGQTVRIMDETLEVSLEVIIRVVFGVQTQSRIDGFKFAIKQFVGGFHPVLAFSRLLHRPLVGLSPWNKFVSARNALHQMLEEEIRLRQQEPDQPDNMLSRILHSTYEDGGEVQTEVVRDQLVTMLLAGHETTQIAMAWGMSWLHRNPELIKELHDQLKKDATNAAILRNELLDGICNESLRLNAIVSDTVRKLKKPMQWEQHEFPAGTNIAVAICLVHEDPKLYPAPLSFRPDRWRDQVFKPNEFMPFGGGVRRCLGAPLAMLEMKLVLATWIREFIFRLPDDAPDVEPVYRRNITMAPKTGIPLVFEGARSLS